MVTSQARQSVPPRGLSPASIPFPIHHHWTQGPTVQRRLFSGLSTLLLVLGATGLSSCGGGGSSNDSSGNASLRVFNVASGYDSLDVYKTSDTTLATAVTSDQASTYSSLAAGTYTFQLKRAGSAATSSTTAFSVSQDNAYTLLAFTSQNLLQTLVLNDGQDAPPSGSAKFRAINLSPEAGSLDVYVIPPGTALKDVSPVASSVGGKAISPYVAITKGTYQVQVTGAGDKSDLRLNIPSLVIDDANIMSLVLTSTPGGVLVHGNTMLQKGAVTANKNTTTRVRLVSGVFPAASVAATLNGKVLATGMTSPAVGTKYELVNSGTAIPDVSVGGVAATTSGVTLVPGGDATLAVIGNASASTVVLLNEDNSPPLVSSNARIRLLHGVQGMESTKLLLTINLGVIGDEAAFGAASESTNVAAPTTTNYLVKVTGGGATVFSQSAPNVPILAGHIYTLFMLGGAASPVGDIVMDR